MRPAPLPLVVTLATALAAGTGPALAQEPTLDEVVPTVRVEVAPPVFSPNGDGRKDETTIAVTSDQDATLEVRILEGESPRRTFDPRAATAGRPETYVWNGRADGDRVDDGTYVVEAVARTLVGLEQSARTTVVVDTRRPRVAWKGLSPEPTDGGDPLRFRFSLSDRPYPLEVRLEIRDSLGVVRAREERYAPGDRGLDWRPTYRNGGTLFPGLYRARLRAVDAAGNRSVPQGRRFRVHRSVDAKVFHRLSGAGRRVAITIDDCHFADAWRRMLDTLRRLRAKATFFCPGDRMMSFPGLVQRTVREGHTLGAHGWDHANMAGRTVASSNERLLADRRTAWKVARATTAPYFRPPYGSYDGAVIRAAGATSHPRVMMWDVDTNDTRRPGAAAIRAAAVGRSRPGSVILMHTLDQSADALPGIIRGLRQRNLRPVTLPRLFRAAGYR